MILFTLLLFRGILPYLLTRAWKCTSRNKQYVVLKGNRERLLWVFPRRGYDLSAIRVRRHISRLSGASLLPFMRPLFHFFPLQKSLQHTEILFFRRKSGDIFAVLKGAWEGVGCRGSSRGGGAAVGSYTCTHIFYREEIFF